MPLMNILPKRQQQTDSTGTPLGGGKMYFYEPGTTTPIITYSNSGLTTQNTSPVILDAHGRASVWVSRNCDMRLEDRNGAVQFTDSSINPDNATGSTAGGLVTNGGFEDDADANLVPDGWTLASESGATNALVTSESSEGSKSFRFTSTGSGGGSLTTSDFFEVNDTSDLNVSLDLRSTVVDVRNIVRVEWYDASQVSISNSDIYDEAAANPTTFTAQNLTATPPSNARFAKLKLIGCDPSDSTAGSTYFDNVRVFYPEALSGAFDNLQLSSNTLSSTDTDGNITIQPNGEGHSRIFGDSDLTLDVEGSGLVSLYGDDNSDSDQRLLAFKQPNGDIKALIGTNSTSIFSIDNRVNSGQTWLQGRNSGGSAVTMLTADPDSKIAQWFAGVEVTRSAARADGSFLIADTVGNFKQALRDYSKTITGSEVRNSTTTLTDSGLEIASVPIGFYQLEGQIAWAALTTAAQGIKFDLIATGTGASNALFDQLSTVSPDNVGSVFAPAEMQDGGPTEVRNIVHATAGNSLINITGAIQMTAAGDFTFRFAQSVSDANTTAILAGSWLRLTPLSQ